MSTTEIPTFCRVCEPLCGVIADVEDGKIIKIRSDPDHVHSRGHFCKKASGMVDVTYDPDRITHPMKRSGGPGEFTRISWEQAYAEIAEKLMRIRSERGPASFATMSGNPPAFSYANLISMTNFNNALDVKWRYGVNADDSSAFQGACHILFGSASLFPKPDIWRTKLLFIVGANPAVSHGSTVCEPLFGQAMKSVIDRGGRVIVIDPRRTETAQRFEHVPIKAGADSYFFSALLHEIIAQGLVDKAFVETHTRNFEALKTETQSCTAEWAETHCGIPAATIRQLAADIGVASKDGGFAIHARTGTCTQRYGTLTNLLLHLVPLISGNYDRPGGMSFGWGLMNQAAALKGGSVGRIHSRGTGLPEVACALPSTALADDILKPGEGQIKAFMLLGSNPALTSAGCGAKLDQALESLDLFFSLDFYMNETNRFADYILPVTTMFEREDYPLLGQTLMLRPSVFATPAVVKPRDEAKEEWQILDDICRHMGMGGAQPIKFMRALAKIGLRITPRHFMDMMIRLSPVGDKYGFKPGGLSFDKLLKNHPRGFEVMKELPTGIFEKEIATDDKRVDLAPPQLVSELARLREDKFFERADYPLRMIGLREVLSHNTWMHNVPSLMTRMRSHSARLHPSDAAARGIVEGEEIVIRSPYGEVTAKAKLSDSLMPGNVAVPHGWGHKGGWKLANASGGINSNALASDDPADTERISAMSVFNGIPIQVSRAA